MATGTPTSHSGSVTDHGYAYEFAGPQIDMAIMDALDFTGLPIVALRGSFSGGGSNVMRVEYIDDIGSALAMTSLVTETDAIALSTPTTGFTTVTLGERGLAYGQTYTSQILNRQPGIDLERLAATFGASYVATIGDLVCTAGAGIAATVGSVLTNASVDDYLDLHAAMLSYSSTMRPCRTIVMDTGAFSQVGESARAEPGFQGDAASFAAGQAGGQPAQGQIVRNYLGLGYDFVLTNRVTASGGGHNNFAVSDGAIGYAVGDTSRIRVPAALNPTVLPQWGLLFQDVINGNNQATNERQARAWLGVAIGSIEVYRQRRWLSIDA
jgi:hypothetical protein